MFLKAGESLHVFDSFLRGLTIPTILLDLRAGVLTQGVNAQLMTDAHRAEWAVDGVAFVFSDTSDEAVDACHPNSRGLGF